MLVSLGGWTYSKFFSDVAATDASRKKFVSSCIDMYIKGYLPVLSGSPAGGAGAAANVFDGFDIDWETPASANGHPGNHYSAADTANYTLLLQEFRTELDALGGPHYQLTAALPAGPSNIAALQVSQVGNILDFGDVMAYDPPQRYNRAFQGVMHARANDMSSACHVIGTPGDGVPGGQRPQIVPDRSTAIRPVRRVIRAADHRALPPTATSGSVRSWRA